MPSSASHLANGLSEEAATFYRHTLRLLHEADLSFLVGGAFAFACYTTISRHTKDFDLFIRLADLERVTAVLDRAGYRIEYTHPHWLAKAYSGDHSIDLIFRSGNGLAEVDDTWFVYGVEYEVLGIPTLLCPPEEIIWTKAFIMERERYDGADVAHLLHGYADQLNWDRLLHLFGPYWRVLLSHLILFGFIYPAKRDRIPEAVMRELIERLQTEEQNAPPDDSVCQGTLLSRSQYLVDVAKWKYKDARLRPQGTMSAEDIARWTDAIDSDAAAKQYRPQTAEDRE